MTTTGEMRKQLRTLWERAEEVGKVRATKGRRALSTAITCRNDAILSVELEFSALRSQNKELRALVEKLDREASNG